MRLISINKLQEKIPLPKWVFKPTTYRMKVEECAIFSVKRSQNFIIHQIKEVDLAQSVNSNWHKILLEQRFEFDNNLKTNFHCYNFVFQSWKADHQRRIICGFIFAYLAYIFFVLQAKKDDLFGGIVVLVSSQHAKSGPEFCIISPKRWHTFSC